MEWCEFEWWSKKQLQDLRCTLRKGHEGDHQCLELESHPQES